MREISNVMEDYLEAIYQISQKRGFVRTIDVARSLNVSSPTVTQMLHKLSERELINYEPYTPVTLTKEGEKIARSIYSRHKTLTKLLNIILVSDRIAEEDACKMEHILHPETIEQFGKLVEFVEKAPHHPNWLEHFKEFCATGDYECHHRRE